MCHICHSSIYIHVRESSCNSLQSHEKQRTPHYSDAFTRFTSFSDHCGEILDHSSSQHYFSSLRFTGICLCTALLRTRCSSKVGLRTQFRPSIRCWRDGLTFDSRILRLFHGRHDDCTMPRFTRGTKSSPHPLLCLKFVCSDNMVLCIMATHLCFGCSIVPEVLWCVQMQRCKAFSL